MSLLTDLQTLTSTQQTNEIASQDIFFSQGGRIGMTEFLKSQAKLGKTEAFLHFEKGYNPYSRSRTGFTTLSGELAIRNAPPETGVSNLNDIGWIYMGLPSTNQAQFQSEVQDEIDWLTSEGLTIVEQALGSTMADAKVSW